MADAIREKLARFEAGRILGGVPLGTLPDVARKALAASQIRCDGESDEYVIERLYQHALMRFREDALAEHEHPFAYCMENVAPRANVSDPEAFCANLVHKATGEWPGKGRGKK